jgi:hypothetical protein
LTVTIILSKLGLFALVVALAYALFNGYLIQHGQFHEDAYILFIYVENILNGNGIVYYPGGPRAEGATDFFWMLLLVVTGKLGLDVGVASILLNALGVFLIVFLLTRELACSRLPSRTRVLALLPFTVLWILSDPLEAAVGGFSVFLYCALVLLAFVCLYREKYILWTPIVAIVIALFRPDGVIIGVLYTLIGLVLVYRGGGPIRTYLLACLAALIVGLAYFFWRFNYFGNLLPLPLYVKSSTPGLAGLAENLEWLADYRFMLIPMAMLAYRRKNLPQLTLLAVPVITLFLVLMLATQSQNIGYRFQAPLFIVLYYILLLLLIDAARESPVTKLALLAYVLLIVVFLQHGGHNLRQSVAAISRPDYMSHFATELTGLLPAGSSIALTEAGRLAYWNQGGKYEFHDIVGLNNEYAAKHAVTTDYLEQLSFDLLMYHHAGALDIPTDYGRSSASVVRLGPTDRLLVSADIDRGASVTAGGPSPLEGMDHIHDKVASSVFASNAFLMQNYDRYDIFLVDYGRRNGFEHVYAINKKLKLGDELFDLLLASTAAANNLSHYHARQRRDELLESRGL